MACTDAGQRDRNRRVDEKTQQISELQTKRDNRMRELKSLSVERLAAELVSDSEKQREPFNSSAYAEAVARGEGTAKQLRPMLKDENRRSFLGLLVLRRIDPEQYRAVDAAFRVAVLVDTLATSKTFNAWGLPHAYWEDPAKAIIEEGRLAEGPLAALLRDRRPAPMWGGEEVQEYERYGYRVCDYAWGLLNAIRRSQVTMPQSPDERNKLIAADPLYPKAEPPSR
jgi:hypothetical protein